jgi:superfamily II DNA/RNA helicase
LKFSDFAIHPKIQQALDSIGFVECTPIQETCIPQILSGKDVAGLAQTGTGKTAAYLLPLMSRICDGGFEGWHKRQFILVLVPTRELADQVEQDAKKFAQFAGLSTISVFGGTSYEKQKQALAAGVEIVVATPGRLIDLYKENLVDLKQVRAVVFDEADRMFDLGFKDDMKFLLQRLPKDRQYIVMSATLNFEVLQVGYQFGANPVEINLSKDHAKAENVKDQIYHVGFEDRPKFLISILKRIECRQVIVFTNYKHNVERIARFLNLNDFPAMGISSLLTQSQRQKVFESFRADTGKNILVATDVAARGLDIQGVDLVINYELPEDAENYVHRIGRTGRAGRLGQAFSLVTDRDVESLQRIENYLKNKVDVGWIDDKELSIPAHPFPREQSREYPPKFNRDQPKQTQSSGPHQKKFNKRDGPNGRHKKGPSNKPHTPAHKNVRNSPKLNSTPTNSNGQNSNAPNPIVAKSTQASSNKPRHQNKPPFKGQRDFRKDFHKGQSHVRPTRPVAIKTTKSSQKHNLVERVSGFIKRLFE